MKASEKLDKRNEHFENLQVLDDELCTLAGGAASNRSAARICELLRGRQVVCDGIEMLNGQPWPCPIIPIGEAQ